MAEIVRLPMTATQQTLARFREEERAFRLVLQRLGEAGRDELFAKVLAVYRAQMRHLRRAGGAALRGLEPPATGRLRPPRDPDPRP